MIEAVSLPAGILAQYALSNPQFVVKTPLAHVWKVKSSGGDWVALKVYHKPDMANERTGFAIMAALNGHGAAKVLATGSNFAITEWLDGPSLGDLARNGQDKDATRALGQLAAKLHQKPLHITDELPTLPQWLHALDRLGFAPACPAEAQHNLQTCQKMAQYLLATETDIRPLHGDLHHDNIRLGPRGYAAFDAKGLLGERCFELANAFRNPKGAETLVRDPARIQGLVAEWSQSFDVPPARLLQWATVKCALSIAWRSGGVVSNDPEFDLLATLLAQTRL